MRKAIVVSIFGLIWVSLTLCFIWICVDEWATYTLFRKVMRVLGCIVWVFWTYNVVTLKYKWLRKLAGING